MFRWMILASCLCLPVQDAQAQVRVTGGVGVRVELPFGRGRVRVRLGRKVDVRSHRQGKRHDRDCKCSSCRPRGHYRLVKERVWVPPVYSTRRDRCGHRVRYCVRQGYWKTVYRRVFVPAPRHDRSHRRGPGRGRHPD